VMSLYVRIFGRMDMIMYCINHNNRLLSINEARLEPQSKFYYSYEVLKEAKVI